MTGSAGTYACLRGSEYGYEKRQLTISDQSQHKQLSMQLKMYRVFLLPLVSMFGQTFFSSMPKLVTDQSEKQTQGKECWDICKFNRSIGKFRSCSISI